MTGDVTAMDLALVYIERNFHFTPGDPYVNRLHASAGDGHPRDGDDAIRTRWLSRGAHSGCGARHSRTLTINSWDHRRQPADHSWWQHHSADAALRKNPR